MKTPSILEEYIWVLGKDTHNDAHIYELNGLLLYTLPLPRAEVFPPDSLVLYIPNMV
jgi:hypothetical protein